jgi:3-deoxy-D-manno-octulosonate 8-phosphate phosphatase (KDO 8-P phosphatase)
MNNIKYIVIDVDGTLTDGSILISSNGEEILAFSIYDGFSIVNLDNYQERVIIISGRNSLAAKKRMLDLKLKNVFLGIKNKLDFIKKELRYLNKFNALIIGDDFPDLEMFSFFENTGCPSNATKSIKEIAKYVSPLKGGEGAVRDILNYFNLK